MPQYCLVTGATGFVGRVLTTQLQARGDHVRTVSRHPAIKGGGLEHHVVDLSVSGELPPSLLRGVDAVFHLAGKAHALDERPGGGEAEYIAANVDATGRLLRAAGDAGVSSFVFVSSAKAAGQPPAWGEVPLDERVAIPPDTPYGRSKRAAEDMVLAAGRRLGMHVCALRPVLIYGPGVKGNLRKLLEAVDHRRFPPLGDVHNRRSLVHVDDVVRAVLLAADRPAAAGQTFLVTDAEVYSTRRLYTATAAALGRRVPPVTVPVWALTGAARTGDAVWRLTGRRAPIDSPALGRLVESAWYSCDKISRTLGYRPRLAFEAALPAMVAQYRAGG